MIFRQLFDPRSSTYTYLLADEASREAVLIDPVFEQFERDAALLRELSLRLVFTLETHVHADHVTAAWLYRERLGSRIVLAAAAGAEGVDRPVREGDVISFGAHGLHVLATPGHTSGCLSYLLGDRSLVFTGDSLMIRSAGRTDFQQGSARQLYCSVHEKLFTLPEACLVYPGHDYGGRMQSSIGEERAFNPRLGGARSEGDFTLLMDHLGLPYPKQIDVALPANLRCGRPAEPPAAAPGWGPVERSFGGVPEVEAEWLAAHLPEVLLLDIREPPERTGDLGHIPGSTSLPLGDLRARLETLPRERPVVAICRAGGRSAQAALQLEKAGLQSASLRGGMLHWNLLGLPISTSEP